MTRYQELEAALARGPRRWLVTGAAGFIGSSLLERLLRLGQIVTGIDNFATGHPGNLESVLDSLAPPLRQQFTFVDGDIRDLDRCRAACEGVDFVLHQAALGSVPRSIKDPLATHAANIDGFVNMLVAARDARVKRFVFASSSSVYGDHPALPKVEVNIGRPLSPYAATKLVNEVYAGVFQGAYGIECIGLRYFNVFGPRQDPGGPYAAVIPRWIDRLARGVPCQIHGDGETSRDFCYVENVVQANLLAATADAEATSQVYNIAFGARTTLNELHRMLRELVSRRRPKAAAVEPERVGFRPGDIRHSLASVDKARRHLGYEPAVSVSDGLAVTVPWFLQR